MQETQTSQYVLPKQKRRKTVGDFNKEQESTDLSADYGVGFFDIEFSIKEYKEQKLKKFTEALERETREDKELIDDYYREHNDPVGAILARHKRSKYQLHRTLKKYRLPPVYKRIRR